MNKCRFCQAPFQDLVLARGKNEASILNLKSTTPILRYMKSQVGTFENDMQIKVRIRSFNFCPACGRKLSDI